MDSIAERRKLMFVCTLALTYVSVYNIFMHKHDVSKEFCNKCQDQDESVHGMFIVIFIQMYMHTCTHVRIQRENRGSGPPPLKNRKNIGFLSNTGLEPLKITKLASKHHRLASETPYKSRFGGGSMLARLKWCVFGLVWILPPLLKEKQIVKVGPLLAKLSGSAHDTNPSSGTGYLTCIYGLFFVGVCRHI